MTYPFGPTTTWVQRIKSGTDSLGNDVWTTTETDVKAQWFDPGISSELVQGQDVVTTQPSVGYPPGTAVQAIDAIRIDGVTYEVDGSPNAYQNAITGRNYGVVVKLRVVTG